MSVNMMDTVLLAKAQTALGTPATPTAGDNAILCQGLKPSVINGKFVERNVIRGAKGNYGGIFTGEHRKFEFEVELAGAGTKGDVPGYGPLLVGCNMQQTITAGVSVEYAPIKGDAVWMTLWAHVDGVLFKMTDARGTWKLTMNAEDIPVLAFTFVGRYHALEDQTFPTGLVFDDFQKPLPVSKTNTPTFTVNGLSLVVQQFGLDYGGEVVWRDLIGYAGTRNPNRKPTASAVFELTSVAIRDWGETVRLGTEMPLVITHGTVDGHKVRVNAPKLQFNAEPTLTELDKTAMLNGSFAVMPNLGNDEVTLTVL